MEAPDARAWRDAYQAGMRTGSGGCPGDDALAALVLGELTTEDHASVAHHVTECRQCAESYRTLRALHADARRGLPRRRLPWLASAAAAVLLVTLGTTVVWLGRTRGPVSVDDTRRGDAVLEKRVQPAAGAVLEVPPFSVSWPAQAGAVEYRVQVYDEDAALLWKGPATEETSITLPSEITSKLAVGGAYFWTVDVAGQVARPMLGPFWFSIEE
ncbi:MAG: hypothetical protein ACRD2X_27290 [Vicinamibacteraceae bacterium]